MWQMAGRNPLPLASRLPTRNFAGLNGFYHNTSGRLHRKDVQIQPRSCHRQAKPAMSGICGAAFIAIPMRRPSILPAQMQLESRQGRFVSQCRNCILIRAR